METLNETEIIKEKKIDEAIRTLDKKFLGEIDISDKKLVIKCLIRDMYDSYVNEDSYPVHFKYLNPLLLEDEDIFEIFLCYSKGQDEVFSIFSESLKKKYKNNFFYTELRFQYEPSFSSEDYEICVIHHTDKYQNNIESEKLLLPKYKANEERRLSKSHFKIINKAFSKLNFKSPAQNHYFNKPNNLPEFGFPSSEDDPKYQSDESFMDKFSFELGETLEILDDNSDNWFSTIDYQLLQMFFITLCDFGNILNQELSCWEFDYPNQDNENFEDDLAEFSKIFLVHEIKRKVDVNKLKLKFLKRLNFTIAQSDVEIVNFEYQNFDINSEFLDYGGNGEGIDEFKFLVKYKGLEKRSQLFKTHDIM